METVAPLEVRRLHAVAGVFTRRAHLSRRRRRFQEVGLKVSDVVVLIDRQQGGEAHLASKARNGRRSTSQPAADAVVRRCAQGLKLHAALTITVMLDTLVAHGKVT